MQVLMSSRRTIQSGEVVTFATEFKAWDFAFGTAYEAHGPFDISASRAAVVVHRATITTEEEAQAFAFAMQKAEEARISLEPTWRGGAPSMFPSEPTSITTTEAIREEQEGK